MSVYAFIYNTDILYIGSTFDIKRRMGEHKRHSKNGDQPFYKYLRLHNINFEDLVIEIVETNFTEKPVLLEFERMFIECWTPICNQQIPGRDKKGYYEDNQQGILIKNKEYYQNNKQDIIIQKKEYRDINKQKISIQRKKKYQEKKLNLIS